jgi:hypothetical protein
VKVGDYRQSVGFKHVNISSTFVGSTFASDDSFVTLDISFNANLIPGRGKRVDCCLPVDEDEIHELVISVVCQHHAWSIGLLVVGVSLSRSKTMSSIVVGWMEIGNSDQDAMVIPVVTITWDRT